MVQLGVQEDRRRRFTSEDLELLAALALPMAAVVENDRLLRERPHAAAAREIQRASCPASGPKSRDIPSGSVIAPPSRWAETRTTTSRWPATQDVDSRWVICVGDVSGKGMPAALLSAAVCPEVRHAVRSGGSPAEVLTLVNRHVCDVRCDTRFVTMIVAQLDPQRDRITIANAGHERPLIRRERQRRANGVAGHRLAARRRR